ncbi:MAG: pyrroline-5-carboxylate reductase [Methylobacterium mesophilicum]|nr:pyrroline-5-carboxylate reductase [Methylobacterium mesophilicum]
MTTRIVLAGCGNMGFAMLKGWLGGNIVPAAQVAVVEPTDALRERAAALGVRAVAEARELDPSDRPALLVLAVKPQVIRQAAADYKAWGEGPTTVLSVAAGTPIAVLEDVFGSRTPVVRSMPNTPAAVGKGMIATFANAHVSAEAARFIEELLSVSGAVAALPSEELMDAVTAVSGSGPAYVFFFIEALERAAKRAGLPDEIAALLARQTVWGAASLAHEAEDAPGTLRQQVTSPNGTTAAALAVLMAEDGLGALLDRAVDAARRRSEELGRA